ncbi:MAG: WD40 repeat domain-containing protein, partial [Anaerovoracaceae bacterium]
PVSENPKQPREYDAVLGSHSPSSTDGLVLGGLEGVKLRLDSNDIKVKIAALSDAIKYGNPGLELVVEALKKDKSESIQKSTYSLLRERTEPRIKKIIQDYDYWNLFDYLYTLEGESHAVACMAISPDGQTLFSGGAERVTNTTKIWDGQTPFKKITPQHDLHIKAWDLNKQKLQYTQLVESFPYVLAISIDGKNLAGGSLCQFKIWDIKPERIKYRIDSSSVRNSCVGKIPSFAFSANGQNLLNLNYSYSLINWGLDWNLEIAWGKDFKVGSDSCIGISHNRQSTVTGKHKVSLQNTYTGKLKKTLQSSRAELKTLIISSDKKTIAGACADSTIYVWDVETGNILHNFIGHRDGMRHGKKITSLAISNDGKTLISGSVDKTIKIWDLSTAKLKKTLTGHLDCIQCVAITPDGQSIISASNNGEIKIWGIPEDIS